MKTTNYEISKQLKKNGLSKKFGFIDYYYNTDKQLRRRYQESYCSTDKENTQVDCFSYDLETILEALPNSIRLPEYPPYYLGFSLVIRKHSIGYGSESGISFIKEKNESFADAAARLLLLLYEKNLIKF